MVEEEEDTKSKVAADMSHLLQLHPLAMVTAEQETEVAENQLLRQPLKVTAMTAKDAENTDRMFRFQSIRQVEEEEDTDLPLHHIHLHLFLPTVAAVALVTDHLHLSRLPPEATKEAQHQRKLIRRTVADPADMAKVDQHLLLVHNQYLLNLAAAMDRLLLLVQHLNNKFLPTAEVVDMDPFLLINHLAEVTEAAADRVSIRRRKP